MKSQVFISKKFLFCIGGKTDKNESRWRVLERTLMLGSI